MREIKFRAWDKGLKQMCNWYWFQSRVMFDVFEVNRTAEEPYWEIMQYTGLKDKNGKEIYEGDIVKNNWNDIYGNFIGKIWVVKFGEYSNEDLEYGSGGNIGFYVENINGEQEGLNNLPSDNLSLRTPEVIGNIYENPELLK